MIGISMLLLGIAVIVILIIVAVIAGISQDKD